MLGLENNLFLYDDMDENSAINYITNIRSELKPLKIKVKPPKK